MKNEELMKIATDLIDEKFKENTKFIKISFYEIRVEKKLYEKEADELIRIITKKLEIYEYNIYYTNSTYNYNGKKYKVGQENLIIAFK